MPRQLVAVAPRKAGFVDYDEHDMGRHQIRVRVEYASPKHGSEVGVFRGEDPFIADLFDEDWRLFVARKDATRDTHDGDGPVLGNQWVGIVVEKGDGVRRFSVGDRVCGYGGIR
jgi:threonine dehydrogenase-like Zn-dependent dehydrogenase